MKHIVSFSSGLSSALTVERVLSRFDRDSVFVVFMDTTIEDDDNYRFLSQMQERWQKEVVYLKDGRSPYQVARDKQIIPNQSIAPCTYELKIKLFTEFCESIKDELTIYIGYDFTELHRIDATERSYSSYGWKVDFPLLWKPYENRPYTEVCKNDWGLVPPP